jgi:ADP-ribosylglycohydrolase
MLGAIAGDIIGSRFEGSIIKTKSFRFFDPRCSFTDDTVLTLATAAWILYGGDYATTLKDFVRRYPHAGYGGSFRRWIWEASSMPYNSWGNGSAMRVSPVGFACDSIDSVLDMAARTANVTHNHPQGVKGAQATALAILLARQGFTKDDIRTKIEACFDYDLGRCLDEIRPGYGFDVSCQGSVPESMIAFLESTDFEDAIRGAISLGGDTDTMACIAGGIAQAYYKKIPAKISESVRCRLPGDLLSVLDAFQKRFQCPH